jgi:hypothetical protein
MERLRSDTDTSATAWMRRYLPQESDMNSLRESFRADPSRN